MLKKSIFHRAAIYSLAATLATPSFGFAAEKRVIYPGQKLPAELGLSSLKVSSNSDADVQVMQRDWFLLKDKELALANPVPGKNNDYVGPVLEATNAQIYFRLISGMILKESLVQMGMSPSRAKRYLEVAAQSGKDFDTTPLAQLGELPEGLKELYNNWDRPASKLAVLPYMILPLSVANDQSQFQHFFKGKIEDTEQQKMCSTINTAAPLAPVHNKLVEKNKLLETLDNELLTAKSNLEQSTLEQIKISNQIKDISAVIETANLCFSAIKSRVTLGEAMPSQDCLSKGEQAMAAAKMSAEWNDFVKTNLPNDKGDFVLKHQAELELKTKEARLAEIQGQIKALTDIQVKAQAELKVNDDKIAALQTRLEGEKAEETKLLTKEQERVKEKDNLIKMSIALPSDEQQKQLGEELFNQSISETKDRNKRIADLIKEISEISKTKTSFQVSQSSLLTQISHLKSATVERDAQMKSIKLQLEGDAGLIATSARLESELKALGEAYIKLQDKAARAEYVNSILSRRVSGLSAERDVLINARTKKEEQAEGFKKQIADASAKKEQQFPGVTAEVANLQALIASYRDITKMGWFLETDCLARTTTSGNKTGIYLSRAKITDNGSKALPTAAVDGGQWGLFNLDYAKSEDLIQNGILLNIPSYVQMAVRQLIENYDYAVAAQFDANVFKCNDAETAKGAAGPTINAMRAAFAIWAEGNDAQAKQKAYQCRTQAPATVAPQAPAQAQVRAPVRPRRTYRRPTMFQQQGATVPDGPVTSLAPGPAKLNQPRYQQPAQTQQVEQGQPVAQRQQQQRYVRDPRGRWVPIPQAGAPATTAATPAGQQQAYRVNVTPIAQTIRNYNNNLARLMAFDGSILDLALPQTGKSQEKDLIERKAISAIARELNVLAGTASNVDSATRRDQAIKALLQVLAFDYEAELAKQDSISAEKAKFEFIFATAAPGKQVTGEGLVVGQTYAVKTIGRVRLYTQPIAKAANQSNVDVGYNDKVTVLPLEDSATPSQAGWVKVQTESNVYGYMPAAFIASSAILDENGQELSGIVTPTNCQRPRVVTSLTNFQANNTYIQRFTSNLKSSPIARRSPIYTVDESETPRSAAASTMKTYLACEDYYAPNGQLAMTDVGSDLMNANGVDFSKVQAIRIIEARRVDAGRGQVLYLPMEQTGGFVPTWIPRRNGRQPRITLGAEVDTKTWGVK